MKQGQPSLALTAGSFLLIQRFPFLPLSIPTLVSLQIPIMVKFPPHPRAIPASACGRRIWGRPGAFEVRRQAGARRAGSLRKCIVERGRTEGQRRRTRPSCVQGWVCAIEMVRVQSLLQMRIVVRSTSFDT